MQQPVTFLWSAEPLSQCKAIRGDSFRFQISVNMRTKTLHNGRDIWRVTAEEWVMMTVGGTKETRGNYITMISVTPNYNR